MAPSSVEISGGGRAGKEEAQRGNRSRHSRDIYKWISEPKFPLGAACTSLQTHLACALRVEDNLTWSQNSGTECWINREMAADSYDCYWRVIVSLSHIVKVSVPL